MEGLGATREAARPGFSLALAQVSIARSRAKKLGALRPLPNPRQVLGSPRVLCEEAGGLPSGTFCVQVAGKALAASKGKLQGSKWE